MLLADALLQLVSSVDDEPLVSILIGHAAWLTDQAGRLNATGCDVAGPANLWMKGIVCDARRDTRSDEAGPPLDIELIGAIRKALAAEIVSYKTAIALVFGGAALLLCIVTIAEFRLGLPWYEHLWTLYILLVAVWLLVLRAVTVDQSSA